MFTRMARFSAPLDLWFDMVTQRLFTCTCTEAVPLLIDSDARTLKQTKPIIEAAKNGESTFSPKTCRSSINSLSGY